MRSPSQPNSTPPVAAPTRKHAIMTLNHKATRSSDGVLNKSRSAGRPTMEKMPISMPSNIQPSSAAASASHLPAPVADLGFRISVLGYRISDFSLTLRLVLQLRENVSGQPGVADVLAQLLDGG